MNYSRFRIDPNPNGGYRVKAYARHNDEAPLWREEVSSVEINDCELDPGEDGAEIVCSGSSPDARFTNHIGDDADKPRLVIDTNPGCNHPVIGLERI